MAWLLSTPIQVGNVVLVERQYVSSHSRMEKNRLRHMENKCIMVEDKVDLLPVMH